MTRSSAFPPQPVLLDEKNWLSHPWGGDWIPQLKNLSPPKDPIGESWEFSLHQRAESHVLLPENEKIPLKKFLKENERQFFGLESDKWADRELFLTKWIDANRPLSIQVHPGSNDQKGRKGKAEAWVVVDVDSSKDPSIYLGFSPEAFLGGSTVEDFWETVKKFNDQNGFSAKGMSPKEAAPLLSFLNKILVQPGDAFFVPPGTIHALGSGIRVYEIQEPQDLTYRIWDWNRLGLDGKPRPLHWEEAKKVLDSTSKDPSFFKIKEGEEPGERARLTFRSPDHGFGFRQFVLEKELREEINLGDQFSALTVYQGAIDLFGTFSSSPMRVSKGQTVVLPEALFIGARAMGVPAKFIQSFCH